MFGMSRSQAARFLADKLYYQMFHFIDAQRHYVFESCLAAAAFRAAVGRSDFYLTAEYCRLPVSAELLNSSYLLLKSRTQRAARCRKEFDRDRPRASRKRREVTSHSAGQPAWRPLSAFSFLVSGDYLLPTAPTVTRRYLYVITSRQPSEASGTLERVDGGDERQCTAHLAVYERS